MKQMLTLEAFADWAEKQPARKQYDYYNPLKCAFCQYLKALGFEHAEVGGHVYSLTGSFDDDQPLPDGITPSILCAADTNTFGALTKRLRAAAKAEGR